MPKIHRTFISFHHNDESYRMYFEDSFASRHHVFITESVQEGDIDINVNTDEVRRLIREKYLRNSSVTVVLVGPGTWRRKHVDWEISASIRHTRSSPRSGLLGILLPNYQKNPDGTYNPRTIPPRLWKNIECGYAVMYDWTENAQVVKRWIHEAFERRNDRTINPHNTYPLFAENRSIYQTQWQDQQ